MTDQPAARPKRIVIIGGTGAGKTTLARQLAARLGYPHLEIDAFHWEANWTETPTPLLRERISEAIAADQWVMDGNYSKVRDLVWGRADTIIWLDYPLWLSLWRLAGRTAHRLFSREELWNGNREQWRTVFSRDSLFIWAFKSYRRHKRTYTQLFREPEQAHLRVIHLKSPRETAHWLEAFIRSV